MICLLSGTQFCVCVCVCESVSLCVSLCVCVCVCCVCLPAQWDSLATSSPFATIALPRTQGNLHDISLLYKCTNASNGCGISFLWDYLPTPSAPTFPPSSSIKMARIRYTQTLQRYDLPTHLGHLLVLPSLPCATRSFLRGSALTLATAGVQVVGG